MEDVAAVVFVELLMMGGRVTRGSRFTGCLLSRLGIMVTEAISASRIGTVIVFYRRFLQGEIFTR